MNTPPFKPGDRVGRLTIIRREGVNAFRRVLWLTRCDCGATQVLPTGGMASGSTRSCGCLQRELLGNRVRKHGHGANGKRSVEYKTWLRIKERCNRPGNKDYVKYGARGITVCERWETSFEDFLSDMGPRPSSRHSIERIDGAKGYSPDNCCWATATEQAANRRSTRYVIVDGSRVPAIAADRLLGLYPGRISSVASIKKITHQEAMLHAIKQKKAAAP